MSEERRSLLAPGATRWPVDPARPIIELSGVGKSYGATPVLTGLDLRIPTGETTVIIGRSGSGKTVLLKIMSGLLRADAGVVSVLGEDLTVLSDVRRTEQQKRMSVVFQNYALFDSMTVADNVAFPLRQGSTLESADIDERVAELLAMLEIDHAAGRLPGEISGGMRKRVSLARAVVTQPEIVFFDEPTTGLDPVMIAFVDELILRTQQRYGITSVVISHDMASVFRLAQHVAVLEGGRIAEAGPAAELSRSTNGTVVSFLGARTHEPLATDNGAGEGGDDEEAPPAIVFDEVHKSFGDNHVLRGVSFEVPVGKITVVIGASGSGKSVIIKHILGLLRPDSGDVIAFGRPLSTASAEDLQRLRREVGMVFQQSALLDRLTVAQNVAFPLLERRPAEGAPRLSRREAAAEVASLLDRLRIADIADTYPGDISAGHRKRVALARALSGGPKLMIYDEPTTGQDPVMIQAIDDMIVEANREFGITSVVISHDMVSTFRIADQVAMVYRGHLAAAASPEALRASTDERVRAFIYAGT